MPLLRPLGSVSTCHPAAVCSLSVDLRLVQQLVQDMQGSSTAAPKIVSLNPFNIEEVLDDALVIGKELGLQQQALEAVAALQKRITAAKEFVARQPPLQHQVVSFE